MSLNYNNGILVQTGESFDDENGQIGVLLFSKAFVQLVCDPFVSSVINLFGYEMTQIFGSAILLLSSICEFDLILLTKAIED